MSLPRTALGVAVGFTCERAVVSVSGDLDVATARDLGLMLVAVLESGRDHVVLDLSHVEFIGGAALDPITAAAEQLRQRGAQLEVRSAPRMARRLLELSGLQPGPAPAVSDSPELLRFSAGLTVLPADEVVTAGLDLVVAVAGVAVPCLGGVSISLRRGGVLATVAASSDDATRWDGQQYDTGQGPCIEASIAGEPCHVRSPDHDLRWPAFLVHTRDEGITSILSVPLNTPEGPVGSLNLYSRQEPEFAEEQQQVAFQLAEHAARLIVNVAAAGAIDLFGDRFEEVLAVRDVVAQAQGMLMDRTGASPEAAFDGLRRLSQVTGDPLVEVAQDMVDATRHHADIDLRSSR